MARIMVNMGSSIVGDGTGDFANHVTCESLRHGMDLMVLQDGTSTGENPTRIEGHSVHGDFELVKEFDKASPVLRAACAASTALGEVVVKRVVRVNGTDTVTETITLGNAKIASVYMHTPPLADGSGMQNSMHETVTLEYDTITWRIADGNIERTYSTT